MKKIMLSLLMPTLLFGEVFAADDTVAPQKDVMFSSSTGTLIIPKLFLRDESGAISGAMSAKLTMDKRSKPYGLTVTELKPLKNDADADADAFGCVLPQTWHEAMGHCMVQ
ncbi:MAG: hypothetical protein KAH20_00520 [Methylococcales bacterium]|nr:hypothetical protein [Methylococcales bacterium]